jgi:cellulose synthase/poly-beta-1,6-N-acetylglucosamine synthase-like glycosyltransferase/peptidoglycan/xylan/chitin deacetylase (PgdA/CDA1 family)/spore germination protein YaaH
VASPIFHDPSARRWRRIKGLAAVAGIGLGIALGALLVATLVNPVLPALGLSPIPHLLQGHAVSEGTPRLLRERAFQKAESDLHHHLAKSGRGAPIGVTHAPFERIAFFVNWDDNSLVSLTHNLADIDTLVPEWLHLVDGSGTVREDDPRREAQVAALVRAKRPDLAIVPLVNNFDGTRWRSDWLAQTLASPTARTAVITQLQDFVTSHGYAGISIDFEAVPARSQKDLEAFLRELHGRFHPLGLLVSQSVPVDDRAFDFRRLAATTDYLILMAYDEHAADTAPGPIASQRWFTAALRARFAEVPADHLVVGLGSYGYDWTPGEREAEELSFQDAMQTASESGAAVSLRPESGNPGYAYADERGRTHQVWFLDAVTGFNQVAAAAPLGPRGFALWRLGAEDPQLWQVLRSANALDAKTAEQLAPLRAGYDIDYEGQGEVLRVTGTPREGHRSIQYEAAAGLITASSVTTLPSGYQITRWGSAGKKDVALSFDDGPDPAWTPRILDILKERQAPATFFVVGENAVRSPELLTRIVDEGHEIGNHTYSHPNIADVSEERLTLEVNVVQRLFESRLGRRSLLFRPPYAEDVEPETPDQVRPLLVTSALGYYTVGMQIDPGDWARPGTDEIVARVLAGARGGEGNVVLLHDSGGDRTQTIAALPLIIDGLRAEGFRLVPVSALLGLSTAAVMPAVPADARMEAGLAGAGFEVITWTERGVAFLFGLGITLGLLRLVSVIVLAYLQKLRTRRPPSGSSPLRIAVLIPAYQERAVICQTVRSVLASDAGAFPVLVIDDGSTDGTAALVRETFAAEPRVRILEGPNLGKWAALNRGFAALEVDVVVALDADTVFLPETVRLLSARFEDPAVGAVAGNARVGNVRNLLTRWQALEYVTCQNLDRRALARLDCISVVPGAVGAWRREAVRAAGGFSDDTLAEDADLTLRLLRAGWSIAYEEHAIALTEAPETVRDFLKQRFRWMFGTLQAAWKHRGALFRRKPAALGWVALPNILVFGQLFPLISPVMDLLVLGSGAHALAALFQHPLEPLEIGFQRALWFYALFVVIDAVTAGIAFAFERSADRRLLWWLLPQRFFYRQLTYYVAIRALLTALRGPRVGWGKLDRSASVPNL